MRAAVAQNPCEESTADIVWIVGHYVIDVYVPTTDGRELSLTRYTQPEPELELLLDKLKLQLPAQPPPKISAAQATSATTL